MGLTTRLVGADDAGALAALMARIEADHMTGFALSEGEILELLRDLPSATTEGAWDGDELVAFTTVMPRPPSEGEQHFVFFGDVDPARTGEGIGTLMLGRALDRARATHRADHPGLAARYVATAYAGRDDQAELLRAAGMTEGRHSFRMLAALDGTADPGEWPAGLSVGSFAVADAEELRRAHNEAFADYPDGTAMDEETWTGFMVKAAHVRPEQSVVVRDAGGAVVAYLFLHEYALPVSGRDGREAYIPYLGTLPGHRGLGLASRMLAEVFRRSHAAGYELVCLDVDTENPTGALAIYERAGFATFGRRDFHQLVEPAG